MPAQGPLQLHWRPYGFALPRALVTSQGAWSARSGWLLRLEGPAGGLGWGEAAALPGQEAALEAAVRQVPARLERSDLEALLASLPAPLACAVGLALAECDGLGSPASGGWKAAPPSAALLPAGAAALEALKPLLEVPGPLTLKWKVAACGDAEERRLLEQLLALLPADGRLRLDANGGWDRATAGAWADRLQAEPRLAWLEQPLAPGDWEGLQALAARVPVALDESLRHSPPPPLQHWRGWQVRRPLLEGDPRPLLAALAAGTPRLMLSTAFETGIGRRLVAHLAALQAEGPTPTAPGLAPGWRPEGPLFAADPQQVWEAAA
jgi:O-succinylbenzoate synthase